MAAACVPPARTAATSRTLVKRWEGTMILGALVPPDGKRLAYTVPFDNGPRGGRQRRARRACFVAQADGSQPRRLLSKLDEIALWRAVVREMASGCSLAGPWWPAPKSKDVADPTSNVGSVAFSPNGKRVLHRKCRRQHPAVGRRVGQGNSGRSRSISMHHPWPSPRDGQTHAHP